MVKMKITNFLIHTSLKRPSVKQDHLNYDIQCMPVLVIGCKIYSIASYTTALCIYYFLLMRRLSDLKQWYTVKR